MTYARISDLPGRSRSDSPQVCTLEITFETDRAQKYSLSSEIQPLQIEEVAQNGVLDRRISADFRRISALKEGQALADCLDIVARRTMYSTGVQYTIHWNRQIRA